MFAFAKQDENVPLIIQDTMEEESNVGKTNEWPVLTLK